MNEVKLPIDNLVEFQAKNGKSTIKDFETGELTTCQDGERIIVYVEYNPDFSSEATDIHYLCKNLQGKLICLDYLQFSIVPEKSNSLKFKQHKLLLATKR